MNKYNHIPLSQDFDNWWYFGRKKILEFILDSRKYSKKIKILEVGPGVGINMDILQQYGDVDILDVDDYFIKLIKDNKRLDVKDIYHNFSEIEKKYDLVVFLDVLEHVKDYETFLLDIKSLLEKDGIAIFSVPAYQSLFSEHDRKLHHFRRYDWKSIRAQVGKEFHIIERYGYNYLLFPIRFLQIKILKSNISDTTVNKLANEILKVVIKLEIFLLKINLNIKAGLSLFTVLKSK